MSAARASSASENGSVVAADDLAGLVTLAGDHERVAVGEHRDSSANGRAPIADLERRRRGGEDLGANGGGVLGARIVVGHDRHIGEAGRSRAHHRPLARIAVAAAAEHQDEAAAHEWPQGRERFLERIGLVGVIDEHRRAADLADTLQASRRAAQLLHRMKHRVGFAASRDAEPGRDQRVRDLEVAGQRKLQTPAAAAELEVEN